MSALLAPVESPTQAPGDRLRSLPAGPPKLARLPFLIVLAVIVAVGMAGVLVLSVNLQQRADMLSTLRTRDADLGFQEASLQARVDEASSVTLLSQRAYRLGMRPDPAPAFINLDTGAITGKPAAVSGREMPAQDPGPVTREAVAGLTSSTTATASSSATASTKPSSSSTASSKPSSSSTASTKPSSSSTGSTKPSSSSTGSTKPSSSSTASVSTGGH